MLYYEVLDLKNKHSNVMFFVNLTNGLEAIQTLNTLNIDYRFTQIQSTRLEQMDIDSIIKEIGAELLLNLAIGRTCCVIDYGAGKKNSKAIYKGVPLIKYLCEMAWFDKSDKPYIINRGDNGIKLSCEGEFSNIWKNLDKSTKRLLRKYKKYAELNRSKKANIIGISNQTVHDGDYDYYVERVEKFYL